MIDKDISLSLNSTTAYVLWLIGAALIVWGMFSDAETAALGLYIAGVGGVLSVRTFFCAQAQREQASFDLGRESVRSVH